MAERYAVSIKVISQKGTCHQQHKVGDEWVIKRHTPEGICLDAFHSLFPEARVLTYGGSLPWSSDPDTGIAVCPDPNNPVVFEVRRLQKLEE